MSENNEFLIVGHRGLCERHVENSLSGFKDAKASGVGAVELDIQFTKDRKIVVFHDYDLTRLCGVKGSTWDYTLEDLKSLRLGNGEENIPTLSEVLDSLGKYRIFIELKTVDDDGGLVNYGLEDALISDLDGRDTALYRFLSFNPLSLRLLKEKDSSMFTGLNVSPETMNYYGEISQDLLERFSVDFVQPEMSMFLKGHFSGIAGKVPIIPWTVNTVKDAIACREMGSSGVISDVPLELMERLK
ncbi:MAG: glycerophosphodiester phosphodiesterase family protein [Thermoplasmataceae archaeon]